ncbi:hypothetical protein [Microcoleus sp. CAWBG58]|uniref:hypothetical protein n=1 Tax=Microcoleus sp. CAWBG58 TaxID=2841651 RepID=UPI0025F4F7A1|nr:hypothetical protein [Microcoleus sp. CAWBG58]
MSTKPSSPSQTNVVALNNTNSQNAIKVIEEILVYIEQDPKYAHLREQAKNPPTTEKPKNFRQKLLNRLKELLIADPKAFHGTAVVSEDLAKQATLTAGTVTVSSLFNFFTNYPLLFFAFKDMGFFGVVLTSLCNILILKFTNDTTTAVSSRTKYNKTWQLWAIYASLSINILQSIASLVGTELMLNQSGLSQLKAAESIQKQVQQVETLKQFDSPQYQQARQRCQEGEQQLHQLDRTNPRWESLYVQLYGTWGDRSTNWNQLPLEKLPTCRQVVRLETEASQNYETAKKNIGLLLVIRSQMGNDLEFLKQKMPLVYQQHFTPAGEIASGIEATRMAILSCTNKLLSGDIAGMGFPLFMLLLSVITSGYACAMTIALAFREDTQKSFSDTVKHQRDFWLEARRRELTAQIETLADIRPHSDSDSHLN